MPKVSCIMSCYKCNKEYLKKTIESILNQSFTDFEYIIADDKFNDFDLKSFIESFHDNRIKFYDNGKNLGYSLTHSKLFDNAKGEYIALVDSDDISHKDRLKLCIQEFEKNKSLDLVSGRIHIFGACRERDDGKEMKSKEVSDELLFYDPIKNPTVMLKRSTVEKYNMRYSDDYKGAGDYELYSRFRNKLHYRILNDILVDYRKTGSNMTSDKSLFRRDHARIIQRNLKDIGIDAPMDLCEMLDPYNHDIKDNGKEMMKIFESYKDVIVNNTCLALFNRKLTSMVEKCKK